MDGAGTGGMEVAETISECRLYILRRFILGFRGVCTVYRRSYPTFNLPPVRGVTKVTLRVLAVSLTFAAAKSSASRLYRSSRVVEKINPGSVTYNITYYLN